MLKYESRSDPLASGQRFARRVLLNAGLAFLLIGVMLGVGMAGYIGLADMNGVDAFLNAAMILSGMGPVGDLPNAASKLFAGCYALISGVFILIAAGFILAPVFHRLLHRFHLDEADETE